VSDDRYVREVDDDALRREKARARALRQTPWWRRRIASGRCHRRCRASIARRTLWNIYIAGKRSSVESASPDS
jgi:hypothetical protein